MNEYSMISCPVFSAFGNIYQDFSSLLCPGISKVHEAIVFPRISNKCAGNASRILTK